MNHYNGFSPAQRNKAQAWLNKQWSTGLLARPISCHACTQDKGIIDAHAEDYSEPFTKGKTDQYHLCFRCHMAVHCRFRNPNAFARYKNEVYAGTVYEPFYTRDFFTFAKQHLDNWHPVIDYYSLHTTNVLGIIGNSHAISA